MSNDGLLGKLRALLWSPAVVPVAAGLLFLTGAISGGTVVLLCSGSWLAWWIAAITVLIRTGFTTSPQSKHVARSLLIGCVCTYGVIWGTTQV